MPDTPRYSAVVARIQSVVEFRCGDCGCFWSATNAETDRAYYCPWCGLRLEPPESNQTTDEAA